MPNGVGYCGASKVIFQSGNKNNPKGRMAASNMMIFDFFMTKFYKI